MHTGKEVERILYIETCCLSVIQYNERRDIVSGICLCNYPNVPSVSPYDWLTWLKTIYGISAATERNTMFVHLLVWDERYSNEFLGELLAAVFDNTTYCQYVILVVPPRVTPVNSSVFEREMTKVLAHSTAMRNIVQFLYLINRYRLRPKLKIRRVVVERQINFVTNHYHIEDYVSVQNISQNDYGRLLHFVLMPIFSAYNRFFFREIARLSELTLWMYPLITCLNDMIPVDPRRQAEYEFPIIRDNLNNCSENNIKDERDDADERNDEFSLFMISPRLAMMPRTIIDTRIVVVGASNCGIAFTEYLTLRLTQRYTQLTNVTLISPHGIPFDNNESNRADYCGCLLPFRGRFHSRYRRCVVARTWINIVYGTITAINRKEKYVTVMNQGNFPYDYLVLTCGLQYQNSTLREKMKTQKQKQNKMQDQLQVPWNCLSINDDMEAFTCIKKIRWLTGDLKERRRMLKSYPARYPIRGPSTGTGTRVIRLTMDQEAVLQEQFNRWPKAPHTADVVLLAAETGLSEADVEGWYAIRLAQWRKEQGLGGNLGIH